MIRQQFHLRINNLALVFCLLAVLSLPACAFGQELFVASRGTNSVLRYNGNTGVFIDTFVRSGSGGLTAPCFPAFGPDGHLYVASQDGNYIARYHGKTGAYMGRFASGGGLSQPGGMTFGPDGDLYVAKVSDGVVGTETEAESTAAATSGNLFRYDAASDQYIFNLGTSGLSVGTYQLRVDLGDDVLTRTVLISLR